MLLTTGTPVMATGGFGAPCINNCISLLLLLLLIQDGRKYHEKAYNPTSDLSEIDITECNNFF